MGEERGGRGEGEGRGEEEAREGRGRGGGGEEGVGEEGVGVGDCVRSISPFSVCLVCAGMFNISKMKNRPMILIGG